MIYIIRVTNLIKQIFIIKLKLLVSEKRSGQFNDEKM
jgi:hypothetical protein